MCNCKRKLNITINNAFVVENFMRLDIFSGVRWSFKYFHAYKNIVYVVRNVVYFVDIITLYFHLE